MLAGVNDAPAQARALGRLLGPDAFKVNLIPYNPTGRYDGSSRAAIERFRVQLERERVPVTVRLTRGRDIAAACGQLAAEPEAARRDARAERSNRRRPGRAGVRPRVIVPRRLPATTLDGDARRTRDMSGSDRSGLLAAGAGSVVTRVTRQPIGASSTAAGSSTGEIESRRRTDRRRRSWSPVWPSALRFPVQGSPPRSRSQPNSVGTPQLKNNAVTTLKVKNGSLLRATSRPGKSRAGPPGLAGAAGAAGPPGLPAPQAPQGRATRSPGS